MSITGLIPWKRDKKSVKAEVVEEYPVDTFRQEMDRLFDGFFGREFSLAPFWFEGTESGFKPRVDVVETSKDIRVSAELPGIDQSDIEVHLDNDVLIIHGAKKTESETRGRGTYRSERTYGAFSRSVRLPAEVTAGKSEAVFKNGVLTVTLPKVTTSMAKAIPVKHA